MLKDWGLLTGSPDDKINHDEVLKSSLAPSGEELLASRTHPLRLCLDLRLRLRLRPRHVVEDFFQMADFERSTVSVGYLSQSFDVQMSD